VEEEEEEEEEAGDEKKDYSAKTGVAISACVITISL
jgi:hypothetical protein